MERQQKVAEIFAAVLEKEPKSQIAFLKSECGDDEALFVEVRELIDSLNQAQANDFMSASALENEAESLAADEETDARIGQTVGHYKILEKISAGGMGAIYLAERSDAEIEKRAAVKIIKRGMDTDAILQRFRNERQILANLEHSNIARLIDAGTTADNLPFFVMEFIDGIPIDEYCRTNNLSETERLELFRKVCAAVSFAHQKLIVHRDLKPSNILVNAEGEPKLLDFGIAKLLNSLDANETQTDMRILTPAYASPEQQRGEIVGTASDVYSLGLILAKMLGVQSAEFKTPLPKTTDRNKTPIQNPKSKIQNLNGDLENILAMSLREDIARRYQSVEQFSEDIRRYLTGLPIVARKDSFSYRASKFVGRNRIAVAAALLFVLSLIGGLTATLWQFRNAQAERARAERRFNDVRQLANSLIFELNPEIELGPTRARQKLVAKSLEYLDSLNQEEQTDDSLKREIAAAYLKIGDIQGRAGHANLGDTGGALASYQKAVDILEPLAANAPANQENLHTLSAAYESIGKVQLRGSKIALAVETHQKALALRRALLQTAPDSNEYRRFVAESLVRIGDAQERIAELTGNAESYPKVLENYQEALQTFQEIAQLDPEQIGYKTWQPSILQRIGNLQSFMAKAAANDAKTYRDALESHRQSLLAWRKLSEALPEDEGIRTQIADELTFIGATQTNLGDLENAFENFREAKTIFDRIAASDKENKEIRYDFVFFYQNLAGALAKKGDISGALKTHREALRIAGELLAENPARITENYLSMLESYHAVSELTERQGNRAEALENSSKEFEIRAKILDITPIKTKLLAEQDPTNERIKDLSNRRL